MSDIAATSEAWRVETDSPPHYISYRRSRGGPTLGRAVLPAHHHITSSFFGGVEQEEFIYLLTPKQWLRPCPTCGQHFHNEQWLRRHYCCQFCPPVLCRAPKAVPIPEFIFPSEASPASSPGPLPAASAPLSQPSLLLSSSSVSSTQQLPLYPQPDNQLVEPRLVQAEREAIAFGVKEAMRKCPPAITSFVRAQCDLLFVALGFAQLVSRRMPNACCWWLIAALGWAPCLS